VSYERGTFLPVPIACSPTLRLFTYRGSSLIRNSPSLGLPEGPRHGPDVGSWVGVGSYERGTPVCQPGRAFQSRACLIPKRAHSRRPLKVTS